MKIIVTGSLGNISKPLTIELVQKGHQVTVITTKQEKKKDIEALGAKAAVGTIEDVKFLTATFTGADAVYCMLPLFDYFDPNLDIMVATRRLIGNYVQAIRESGVKKVVHLSSIGAHTDKGNGLLAFHHLAETIFQTLPQDVIIKHMRPVGFYNNVYDFMNTIKGKGFLGMFLTLRFAGFTKLITGKTGVIAANYGAEDKMPWVSPIDIAAATAEELTTPFTERKFRYIASEELTCNEIAKTLGAAIGKPFLRWWVMSDKDMLGGLKMFKIPQVRAEGIVAMNAAMHDGSLFSDYYRHKPALGKVKIKDFAKEFAAVYNRK
jgi:uncharacterized protein YbjT (DUF2867 family)